MIDDPTDPYGGDPPPPRGDPTDDQLMIGWWDVITGTWRWMTNPYA